MRPLFKNPPSPPFTKGGKEQSHSLSVSPFEKGGLRGIFIVLCELRDCLPNQQWGDNQRHNGHKLNQYVHRRTGCIFAWITHCVTDNCRLMGIGALSAKVSVFYIFLCIIPHATGICQKQRHWNTNDGCACKESSKRLRTHHKTYKYRGDNCQHTRYYHLLQGCSCTDINTPDYIRLCLPLHKTFDLTELASYFVNHLACSPADRRHRKCGYEKRYNAAEKNPHNHIGFN